MSDYSNWREFARNVCLPMIGDDEAALSVAEKEFDRKFKENRYYVAAGFVIAENTVTRQENLIDAIDTRHVDKQRFTGGMWVSLGCRDCGKSWPCPTHRLIHPEVEA